MIDCNVGENGTFFTYLHTIANDGVGIDLRAVANHCAVTDIGEGSDVDIFTNRGLLRNEGAGIDTSLTGLHRLVELQQLGHTLIGVLHTDKCCSDRLFQLNIVIDEHHTRLCVVNVMGVFGIRQERDGSRFSFFDFCKSVNGGILVAFHASSNQVGYLLGCKFHFFMLITFIACKDSKNYSKR